MNALHSIPAAAAALLLFGCAHAAPKSTEGGSTGPATAEAATGGLEVSRAASRPPTPGGAEHFTGDAMVTPLFGTTPHTHAMGASVSFEPGARSAWHSHPAGQTLIITSGTGWVQEWARRKVEVQAGDVVWTPPDVKHWHGATATESMTNIAIQEAVDGRVVDWMEQVTDAQYDE